MEAKTSELSMQTVLDSLCRCFGSPVAAGDLERFDPQQQPAPATTQAATAAAGNTSAPAQPAPATPDAKRRTKNMKLQEEQWDTLFDSTCNGPTPGTCAPSAAGFKKSMGGGTPKEDLTLEQAQAVAKAKLAANRDGGGPVTSVSNSSGKTQARPNSRRKRSSPDDIFRSKKPIDETAGGGSSGKSSPTPGNNGAAHRPKDAFSRFLTNNPVLANSLCFATPIRGSNEEPLFADGNSVVSDANTLNTAEDTITSTLYYEQVKLAGLKQKNPPMPLFGAYEVKASDDIRQVATCESYSSTRMKDWLRQNPELLKVDEATISTALPHKKKKHHSSGGGEDDIPPQMVNSSSDSTGRSV